MGLAGYGVLKGTRDPSHPSVREQGEWYHGILWIDAPSPYPDAPGLWKCAVDVATKSTVGVQYKVFHDLNRDLFAPVLALPPGYSDLAKTPTSGAIDYVRSPLFGYGCMMAWIGFVLAVFGIHLSTGWIDSTGDNALDVLQAEFDLSSMVYVFGEQFHDPGLVGMHNIHMNQGDPPLSPDGRDHQGDDGIWQDGGTVMERADGTLHAVLTKFNTQTFNTNDQGLPK
jgi:Uncharacterized conserved protein (DUF2278)